MPDPFQARHQRLKVWPPSPEVIAYLERKIQADPDWLAFYQYFGWNYPIGPKADSDKIHYRNSCITIEDVPCLGRDGGPDHMRIIFDLETGKALRPPLENINYDFLVPGKYWVYLPSALAVATELFQQERTRLAASRQWLVNKYYVRFGFWPANERSEGQIHYGTGEISEPFIENGVSVYEAHWDHRAGRWDLVIPSNSSGWGTLDMLIASNREILLVQGDELPEPGADGEPLLRNLKLIKKLGPCDIEIKGTYDPAHDGGFDCQRSNFVASNLDL